jgi:hypothetical protein
LEAALDDPAYRVESWGDARDEEPHELVAVALTIIGSPKAAAAGGVLLGFMGSALADAFKSATADAIKDLAGKLYKLVRRKELSDFTVSVPSGSRIYFFQDSIRVEVKDKYEFQFKVDKLPKGVKITF